VAIASGDRPRELWRALDHSGLLWLLGAVAVELIAYAGYVVAYRAAIRAPGRPRLSLMLSLRLVVAGFGPFVPLGGFAFDRHALSAVHRNRRHARVQILGLGVIEYLMLAPAAWACALVMLLQGQKASALLTVPWVVAVPPGFLLAWWLTHPHVLRRFDRAQGRIRCWIGDLLAGVGVMRTIVSEPVEHAPALIGMAIYWAAEIACLAFALECFHVELPLPALVIAYATGYAASRRSLPLGGAGITEVLLTLSLIWVHVNAVHALLAVIAYRLVNFLAPMLPGLLAHSSLSSMLEHHARDDEEEARLIDQGLGPAGRQRLSPS
jgi:uncharacterized membrane protein YbhN (UPF0104 family)